LFQIYKELFIYKKLIYLFAHSPNKIWNGRIFRASLLQLQRTWKQHHNKEETKYFWTKSTKKQLFQFKIIT